MKPNPNWVEAPLKEPRWTVELGLHFAEEFEKREADGNIIILLKLTRPDGTAVGVEERRYPARFNPEDYSTC